MRALGVCVLAMWLATPCSALAESKWLESQRLDAPEIGNLCEQVSGVRLLARMQMLASGNLRWRLLSRQELVIESTAMGVSPLDPSRCYVIARAGPADENERRAFEVRDFAANAERTSILTIGRAYDPPPVAVHAER